MKKVCALIFTLAANANLASQECRELLSPPNEFFRAIEEGNISRVKGMLWQLPHILYTPNQNGTTPTMIAVYLEEWEIANLLIARGANLGAQNHLGKTVASFYSPGRRRGVDLAAQREF